MVDENLLREILLNATARKEFFNRLRKRGATDTDSGIILGILDRIGDLMFEHRIFLDKTIEALLLDDDKQKIEMLKSVKKRMTKEEFSYISKVANIEDLWTRMDNIIDELKKTD